MIDRKAKITEQKKLEDKARKEMIVKVRRVRSDINENGLRSVQLKLEYLEGRDEDVVVLESYRKAIDQHLKLQEKNRL